MNRDFLSLGGSLYVPAIRSDMVAVAQGVRFPQLRSVILCTEDSIAADDVPLALNNIQFLLSQLQPWGPRRFLRVRSPELLSAVLSIPGCEKLDGFVIPKATRHNLDLYLDLLPLPCPFWIMPTLETEEAFDAVEMRLLRCKLETSRIADRILGLRIGGADLQQLLGIRRRSEKTIYSTPLGYVISSLVTIFHPAGFSLSAPVFEGLEQPSVLREEVQRDLDHGLCSKTAIHPEQVNIIEAEYAVSQQDFELAESLLRETSPTVYRLNGTMCEKATHTRWARTLVERAALFGVREVVNHPKDHPRDYALHLDQK